jgi:hypothetical protein
MPTYLHQLIAVQRGIDEETAKTLGAVKHLLAIGGEQDPLTGISRTYQPVSDDPADQLPPQARRVQITAAELIDRVSTALTKMFDVKFQREEGNTDARSDVTVDGEVLLTGVPVGYLMFLEAQVTKIVELIDEIPTLNPADNWSDTATGLREGVWASDARRTAVPRRVPQVQVLSPAQVIDGQKFDPQVRPYETEVTVGWWTTVKYSGQMDPKVQQDMRARAVKVTEAVRKAREAANRLEVNDRRSAAPLLTYILGETRG